MKYTIESPVFFRENSVNRGDVKTAVFLDNAVNRGVIDTFAIFLDDTSNYGNVSAARFESNAKNLGVALSSTFVDNTQNLGYVVEGVFLNTSQNKNQVLGTMYIADAAINTDTGFALNILFYNRYQGAYPDMYLFGGQKNAPQDFNTQAYEVNSFWYTYDAQGNGSFANGAYRDHNEMCVFREGVKIASFDRINIDADIAGIYSEGLINLGTGDRWYFYGNYYSSDTQYKLGKTVILSSFCSPGVEGGYVTDYMNLTNQYYCYNSCIITKSNRDLIDIYQHLSPSDIISQIAQNEHRGKISIGDYTRWVSNINMVFESLEAYNEYTLRNIVPDNENHIETVRYITVLNDVIERVYGDIYQDQLYIYNPPYYVAEISTDYNAVASVFTEQSNVISTATQQFVDENIGFYGGPLYYTISSSLSDTSVTAVTSSTPYTRNYWIRPDGLFGDEEFFNLYITQLLPLCADAWGALNIGEYIYTTQGINYVYDVNGERSGRYYLKGGSFFGDPYTESTFNNTINNAANAWCADQTSGQFPHVPVSYGRFKLNAQQGLPYYDAQGIETNYYCCDSITYDENDYENTMCFSTIPNAANTWGQSNNGRYKHQYLDRWIYTDFYYCNTTLLTSWSSYQETTCFQEEVLSAARFWGTFYTGRYAYNYIYTNFNYDPFYGEVTDLYYCNTGIDTYIEYDTSAAFYAGYDFCINKMIEYYASYNSTFAGRLSVSIVTDYYYTTFYNEQSFKISIHPFGYVQQNNNQNITRVETPYWTGCGNVYTSLEQACDCYCNYLLQADPYLSELCNCQL